MNRTTSGGWNGLHRLKPGLQDTRGFKVPVHAEKTEGGSPNRQPAPYFFRRRRFCWATRSSGLSRSAVSR